MEHPLVKPHDGGAAQPNVVLKSQLCAAHLARATLAAQLLAELGALRQA